MKPALQPLAVGRVDAYEVRAFYFDFKPIGWATWFVDDRTGTLSLSSDWGDYAHRWGRGSWLGVDPPDLSRALATRLGADYIARKLFGLRARAHDPEKTRAAFRDVVLDRRREGYLDRETARALWRELDDVDWSSSESVQRAADYGLLGKHFSDAWELCAESETTWFLVVRDQLLPVFLDALRKEVKAA